MLKLIIYKDKITTTKWEEEKNDWTEHDITSLKEPITAYFDRNVEIKQDVTVEDFMNHLRKYEKDIDFCFYSFSDGIPLKLYFDEMDSPTDVAHDLGEVEMCWEGEILNDELMLFGYLRAYLTPEKIAEVGEMNNIPHDISFLPINVWKNCYFRFNEGILVHNLGEIDNINSELVFEGYKAWTFFDVLSNFIADITMNGTPEERNSKAESFVNKKYDVKEVAKDREQAQYWLDFLEEELKEMNEKMRETLENEEYENAEVLQKDINAVTEELKTLKEEVEKYNL